MDVTTIVLVLLGFLQVITFGLFSWSLLTIVSQGKEISTLQANATSQNVEIDRRFDEMNLKLDEMKNMLGEALLHRRTTDGR